VGTINIANSAGRDAVVTTESVRSAIKVRWVDEKGRQASSVRFVKAAVNRGVDALLETHGSLGSLAQALLDDDPEICRETTGRMLASSPVFGVGVGRYFDRSAEFMPEELRGIYGNENAHNYFAQQFAELGPVGGLLFIWLIIPPMFRAWRHVRTAQEGDGAILGLLAGTATYVITCITGHPLLVPEAALPFWAAFGALSASTTPNTSTTTSRRRAAAIVGLFIAAGMGQAVLAYSRTTVTPADKGFHGLETTDDGMRFRWMTRHAVTYVPATPGFVTLHLRAGDERALRPLVVDIVIDGRVMERREIRPGPWTRIDLGVRDTVRTPFRRVDLRANQEWTQEVRLGRRTARRPISAMVGEIVWTPLEATGGTRDLPGSP